MGRRAGSRQAKENARDLADMYVYMLWHLGPHVSSDWENARRSRASRCGHLRIIIFCNIDYVYGMEDAARIEISTTFLDSRCLPMFERRYLIF